MMSRAAILTALLIGSLAPAALAQYVPESVPRVGESRANVQRFHSSHNSFERDGLSITDQLDKWNVWEIELDVHWRADCSGPTPDFFVFHYCLDLEGADWLKAYLSEIQNTHRFQTGFFFLNLELKDDYCCYGCGSCPNFPSDYMQRLQTQVQNYFGTSSIYTWQDFTTDNYQWPSIQELLRRGKHVAITANENWGSGEIGDTIFLQRGHATSQNGQVVLRNSDNQSLTLLPQTDRYMSRWYYNPSPWPTATCEGTTGAEDSAIWKAAMDNGFNFPATVCVTQRIDPRLGTNTRPREFHPPLPAYAIPGAANTALGTWNDAYSGGLGLLYGLDNIKYYNDLLLEQNQAGGVMSYPHPCRVEVQMVDGEYDVSSSGGVLNAPVVLKAPWGNVVLR